MPNVINTLYAPLISTWMRAFPNTGDAVVYFSYSPLNNNDLVQRVHVSLVNQANNENAFADPTGIEIYEVATTIEGTTSANVGFDSKTNMNYVIIPKDKLKGGLDWNINQYYKVQIRLDSQDDEDKVQYGDYKSKILYLNENTAYFSEWSTVCLLRPILEPEIYLKPWDLNAEEEDYTARYNKGIVNLTGFVTFGDGTIETETLESYVIDIIKDKDSTEVLWTSGNIFTANNLDPNEINYQLTLQGLDTSVSNTFYFKITITTKNQYVKTRLLKFSVNDYIEMTDFRPYGFHEDDPNNTELSVDLNEEEGYATFRFKNLVAVYGKLYVKRSSNISNFKEWETIYEQKVAEEIDVTIKDTTISAFVWYRYSIQFENTAGAFSRVYYTTQFLAKFYNAFISRLDKQLPVRYDFKVSNVKPVVNRAKIDTLGGRYPKFVENAMLNYKQFTVTGVISAEADFNQMFLKKSEYFGDEYSNYQVYLQTEDGVEEVVRNDSENYAKDPNVYLTTTRQDYFWEREFRENAVAWLNDGEPKLFRSPTEGSIPVMITDVSLTPKAQMNRLLYDFSATMYEIGKGESLADLETLGIYHVPRIEEIIGDGDPSEGGGSDPFDDHRDINIISQIWNFQPTDNNNQITSGQIQDTLLLRYKMGGIYAKRTAYNLYIKNVKIYFHNKPHLFYMGNNNQIQLLENPSSAQVNTGRLRLGYTFQIQTSGSSKWSTIFVNDRGYYQVPAALDVTGLAFNQYTDFGSDTIGDTVTVEYVATFSERAAEGTIISSSTVQRSVIGQYEDVFAPDQWLGDKIRNKYSYKTHLYTQHMLWWKGICLDVTPYAVAYIHYKDDATFRKYVVGQTGVLHMLKDFIVENLYFVGVRMFEKPIERQDYLQPWEYTRDNTAYAATADVKKPKRNTVYKIANADMIYYNDSWTQFTDEGDGTGIAKVDVEGHINFIGDVIREEY